MTSWNQYSTVDSIEITIYIYYYIKIADDGCFILEDWLKYVKINILDTKMTIQPLLLSYDGKDEQDDEDLEAINLLVPTVP